MVVLKVLYELLFWDHAKFTIYVKLDDKKTKCVRDVLDHYVFNAIIDNYEINGQTIIVYYNDVRDLMYLRDDLEYALEFCEK